MKASVGGSNVGIETAASTTDKIVYDTKSAPVYDEKSAPVYDTNSAKVYETETVKTYYGWQTIDGATYYFDKDGDKVTGQQVIQGISYTFNSDGVRSGTIGIDVSKYQTGINWTKVKNAGINFVMIRCGYRGYGSGVLVEDPMYRSHISGAKAAGLRVGVYFFSQAVNEAEAVEEASMAVSLAKKYGINMPIAIDSEYANGGKGRADGLSKSARTAVTKAFCNTVKSAGYTPMVYASKSWFSSHLDVSQLSSYRIWVAHYADKCGYKGNYHIWQNTDKGKVDGVPGYVDMNISSI
jgi:GH25 family lysozyme M1 (1,4-beta-N-acetylmuramidase)